MHQAPRHQHPFTTTPTSLAAATRVDLEGWLDAGAELLAAASAVNWHVGDWLLEAHRLAGGDSDGDARVRREVCSRTNMDPQSLERLRHVAEQVPPELRREGLSWAHHAAAAAWHPEDVVAALAAAEAGVDEPHGWRRLSVSETTAIARRLAAERKVAA
jgi:hypothetical protein